MFDFVDFFSYQEYNIDLKNICYLCQGGYVFAWVCLSICLFVNKITQKLMDRF